MAEDKRTLAERLAAVTAEVERLAHDGEMQGAGRYKYTSINAIADLARPLLAKHGVALIPGDVEVVSHEPLAKGYHVVIRRYWAVVSAEGSVQMQSIGASSDSSDKAYNKAHTYARKNLLVDLLNLSTGEDPDSERPETQRAGTSYDRPAAPAAPRAPRREPTNYSRVVEVGEAKGMSINSIHETLGALGFDGPGDLEDPHAYEAAMAAIKEGPGGEKGGFPAGTKMATDKQQKRLRAIQGKAGVSDDELKLILMKHTHQESTTQIPMKLYEAVCTEVENWESK